MLFLSLVQSPYVVFRFVVDLLFVRFLAVFSQFIPSIPLHSEFHFEFKFESIQMVCPLFSSILPTANPNTQPSLQVDLTPSNHMIRFKPNSEKETSHSLN